MVYLQTTRTVNPTFLKHDKRMFEPAEKWELLHSPLLGLIPNVGIELFTFLYSKHLLSV